MDSGVIGLRQPQVRNRILEARLIKTDQQGYEEQESLEGESGASARVCSVSPWTLTMSYVIQSPRSPVNRLQLQG
jgi:hypothetical protein